MICFAVDASVDDGRQHDDDTGPATPQLGVPISKLIFSLCESIVKLVSLLVFMCTGTDRSIL